MNKKEIREMLNKRQIIDIERELILRVDRREDFVYLDFFTKDGLKMIKISSENYNKMLEQLKGAYLK